MTPDELRALADALLPMAAAPCFDGIDIERAADYLRACADAKPVAVPAGWKLVPVEPTPEMLSAVGMMDGYDWHAPGCSPDADHANWYSAMIAAAPAAPQAEPKREPLPGLAPTHRCPACGALWRQCDDASWNLRSALCCGLCDAGRVELVRLLDEPKREPLSDGQLDAAFQTAPEALLALVSGETTVGAFKTALRRLGRAVERAHGIGGSDAE